MAYSTAPFLSIAMVFILALTPTANTARGLDCLLTITYKSIRTDYMESITPLAKGGARFEVIRVDYISEFLATRAVPKATFAIIMSLFPIGGRRQIRTAQSGLP